VKNRKRELVLGVRRGAESYSTSLDFLEPLSPDDACKQVVDDPTHVWLTLGDICSAFGLTIDELHAELKAGRLVAHMLDGKNTIAVNAEQLLRWMTITGRQSVNPS
jgi:hypothetical protein